MTTLIDLPTKTRAGRSTQAKNVNVRAMHFCMSEQDRCIFGLTNAAFGNVLGGRGKHLMELIKTEVGTQFKQEAVPQEVHVLFHWNDHSFFTCQFAASPWC